MSRFPYAGWSNASSRSPRRVQLLAGLVVLGASAVSNGCGSDVQQTSARRPQVTDSAGVAIIENTTSAWDSAGAWRIEPEPLLQIGVVDGEDPYVFEQISSLGRLSDGRLFLFERGSREIRAFDARGTYLNSIGRAGDGPGEFPVPARTVSSAMATGPRDPLVVATPGDTLLAWNARGNRLAWFLPNGTLVREASYDPAELLRAMDGLAGASWQLLPDGTVFFNADNVGSALRSGGPRFQEGTLGVTTRRVGLVLDGFTRTGATLVVPFSEWYGFFQNPAYPMSVVAPQASPVRLHVSTPERWEVRTYDAEGALVRIVRLPLPRSPLSQDWLDTRLAMFPPSMRAEMEAAFDEFTMPDSVSPIEGLRTDTEGNLWIADAATFREGGVYDAHVIDAGGRWLGRVEGIVPWMRIQEIGSDYVLLRWSDDLSLQYLRVHRLVKP